MTLPTDTTLDTDPPNISEDALKLLKTLYVAFGHQLGYTDWSDTRIINAIDDLRKNGHVEIIRDMVEGSIRLQLTELGWQWIRTQVH